MGKKHEELLFSLSSYIDETKFALIYNPSFEEGPKPDLVTVSTKVDDYHKRIHIYEVKTCTANLREELHSKKWETYLPYCDKFTFAIGEWVAVPPELYNLPIGIITFSHGYWRELRRAPVRGRVTLTKANWCRLLKAAQETKLSHLRESEKESQRLASGKIEDLYRLKDKELASRILDIQSKEDELKDKIKQVNGLALKVCLGTATIQDALEILKP